MESLNGVVCLLQAAPWAPPTWASSSESCPSSTTASPARCTRSTAALCTWKISPTTAKAQVGHFHLESIHFWAENRRLKVRSSRKSENRNGPWGCFFVSQRRTSTPAPRGTPTAPASGWGTRTGAAKWSRGTERKGSRWPSPKARPSTTSRSSTCGARSSRWGDLRGNLTPANNEPREKTLFLKFK